MFKNKNFFILWLGQLVSIFGGRFSELVIPWVVLQVTGSPIKTAIVAISTHLAPILFSLPAGVWIETQQKKPIAMTSELVRALTMAMLVLVIMFDQFNIAIVAAILFVSGIAGLFFRVSFSTILPGVAGRDRLVEAHNYIEAADAVSTLVGPLLAGFVLSSIGAAATLGIDALTFFLSFVSIAALTFVDKPDENRKSVQKGTFAQGLDGLKLLFSSSIQRFITLNHIVLNFITHAITLLVIIYAKQSLGLTAEKAGILLSGAGAGNIIGIFVMNRLKDYAWNRLYGTILLVSGIGVLFIALSTNLWLAFLGMSLFDGALSMVFVLNGAARQTVTPDDYLARISSGGILLSGIVVILANGFAGVTAEWFNPVAALLICAGMLFLNSLASFIQTHLNKSVASFDAD